MSQTNKFNKLIHRFNAAGLIHTLISVSVFVLSLLNYLNGETVFYLTLKILSIVTLVNSIIWLICAIILILAAKKLNNPKSVKHTRKILLWSVLLVLTPDILFVIVFYLPMLKDNPLINIVGFVSPALVFIGWLIGKRLGKKIQKNQQ